MEGLKAIDTKYRGKNFRSRLEARWAVFFDYMGIKWWYEHEGYDLNGEWYLPDFYLPTFSGGMYVEVKPFEFNEDELRKATNLVKASKKPLWMAIEEPTFRVYEILTIYPTEDGVFRHVGVPNCDQAQNEDRMYIDPFIEEPDGKILDLSFFSGTYLSAVEASSSYRF